MKQSILPRRAAAIGLLVLSGCVPDPRVQPVDVKFFAAVPADEAGAWVGTTRDTGETLHLAGVPILTSRDVRSASGQDAGDGTHCVLVVFNDEAAARFAAFSRENIGKRVAIVVDGEVISAPEIKAEIQGAAVINGGYTAEDAEVIAKGIRRASRSD